MEACICLRPFELSKKEKLVCQKTKVTIFIAAVEAAREHAQRSDRNQHFFSEETCCFFLREGFTVIRNSDQRSQSRTSATTVRA